MQDAKKCKKFAIWHHRIIYSGYILATKARIDNRKKLLSSNIFPTRPHNMVNFSPLAPQIISLVWGTPANFNRFRILASLLQRRRSTEANQTLHYVWPSPGLVHYIYILGGSCPVMQFCQVQNSLCIQVLHFPILAALLHGTQVVGISHFVALSREQHYIFDRVAITLGIAPHSSLCFYSKKQAAFK